MMTPTTSFMAAVLAACLLLAGGQPAYAQAQAQPQAGAPNEYRLGSGDVVRISVFQNPELTLETRVTEAGLISYPLLGNVRIGGQSVTAAEKLIADGLRKAAARGPSWR